MIEFDINETVLVEQTELFNPFQGTIEYNFLSNGLRFSLIRNTATDECFIVPRNKISKKGSE